MKLERPHTFNGVFVRQPGAALEQVGRTDARGVQVDRGKEPVG